METRVFLELASHEQNQIQGLPGRQVGSVCIQAVICFCFSVLTD